MRAASAITVTVSGWIEQAIARELRSRRTTKLTDPRTSSDQASNPSMPGRMIRSTARKPMAIAVQRRIPTRSPRKSAAPAVTANGVSWAMAVVLAISRRASAVR